MAMTKCAECKAVMSTKAAACPACGAVAKKKTSVLTWLVTGFVALGFVGAIYGNMSARSAEQQAAAAKAARYAADPAAKLADERAELARKEKAAADEKRFQLAVAALRSIKASLRDPESLQVDSVGVSSDSSVVCATYRAKNGFGGLNVETVAFVDQKPSREPRTVASKCRDLLDFKHARRAL